MLKFRVNPEKSQLKEIEEYREKMIKQKEEYEKWKKKERDSDMVVNEKDNKKKYDKD